MNYFSNTQTLEQAKNLFRTISKKLHPDTSGYDSQADFVSMMKEFKTLSNKLKYATGHDSDKDFDSDKFYNTIQKFDTLVDIKISFVGSFIWLEDIAFGAMYQQKDIIKGIEIEGLNRARWASAKKNWYYSPIDYKQNGKSRKSLAQIKNRYGSKEFTNRILSLT
jgi:curved DNA-binding protein CbpA